MIAILASIFSLVLFIISVGLTQINHPDADKMFKMAAYLMLAAIFFQLKGD